ncbi:MAG: hypothetical protein ACW975_06660 [Candidatus Thorarchaeota archaeon]|jgi:hypothetical protein
MSWTAGLIGLLTVLLLVSVILVSPRMSSGDVMFVGIVVFADIIALLLLIYDTFNRAVSVEFDDEMEL